MPILRIRSSPTLTLQLWKGKKASGDPDVELNLDDWPTPAKGWVVEECKGPVKGKSFDMKHQPAGKHEHVVDIRMG